MEKKVNLIEELKRYNQINKYLNKLIVEQEVAPTPTEVPPMPDAETPTEVPSMPDAETPTENIPAPENTAIPEPESDDTTEEIDITDLVNMTKSIKTDLESKGNNKEVEQKMDDIFSKLTDLEDKLQGMNDLVSKIDNLSNEIQSVRPKTPEEKLEMRSLDSYPFNKNPQEFFADKQQEMRATGKNEYVLTKDDVQNYGKNEIIKTFNPDDEENEQFRY